MCLLREWLFMYDSNENCFNLEIVNMVAEVKCLLLVYLVFNVCYCRSLVTELLETVTCLWNDCSRFYPHADRNMAENLIVCWDWRGFPNSGISIKLVHLWSRNIYVQCQCVRESFFQTDPAGSAMRWFNTLTRHVYSVRGPNSLWHIDGLHCHF